VNKKRNGELYYEEKTITAIRDPQGEITHFVSTGKDVTERHRAEDILRASMERARLVMLATTDAIWDWDLVTGAVQWNHGLRTLFGYPVTALDVLPRRGVVEPRPAHPVRLPGRGHP
jgi:PAS domain-containing protein